MQFLTLSGSTPCMRLSLPSASMPSPPSVMQVWVPTWRRACWIKQGCSMWAALRTAVWRQGSLTTQCWAMGTSPIAGKNAEGSAKRGSISGEPAAVVSVYRHLYLCTPSNNKVLQDITKCIGSQLPAPSYLLLKAKDLVFLRTGSDVCARG